MKTPQSLLQKSRHGIYYLRIQRAGIDRRISLRTRDPNQAKIAAAICHATLSHMKIDPTKIKGWTLRSDCQCLFRSAPQFACRSAPV